MIEVRASAISKTFGATRALDDVSVTFGPGRVHALCGENGAGKSTLGKILAGVIQPDHGFVEVDGRRVELPSPRRALDLGITAIAQESAIEGDRTAVESVFLGLEGTRLGVVLKKERHRRYLSLLESTGFDVPPDAVGRDLRVAERLKIEVLRVVARNARLIVFDEPTAALDDVDSQKVLDAVRMLRDRGATVVYVSHKLDEVLAVADHVTVLRNGRHVATAPAHDWTPATLVTSMLGRDLDQAFPDPPGAPASAKPVLSIEGLTRSKAISPTSLTVRAGEIVGLAGLVGSGRSELARLISGADRPDGGSITVNGASLRLGRPAAALRGGVAMVPEDRSQQGLILDAPVRQNVTLAALRQICRIGVIKRRTERTTSSDMAAQLGVTMSRDTAPVRTLSGGNQQKVMLSRYLLTRPSVLIVDEPTRGVDIGAKRAIYDHIVALADAGTAVMLISSEIEEVIALSHRVGVMRNGTLVTVLPRSEATPAAVLHAAFGTEEDHE